MASPRRFRHSYNVERSHEALGQRPPSLPSAASPRSHAKVSKGEDSEASGLPHYLEYLDAVPVALQHEETVIRAYGERHGSPEVLLDVR